MKTKTINAVISKKMNEWLQSISDENLRKDLMSNIIVTGGCITSMFQQEKVNDFDVYFKSKAITKRVAQYYCDVWNVDNQYTKNKIGKSATSWVLDGQDVQDWKDGNKQLSSFASDYIDMDYDENMEWDSDTPLFGASGMLLSVDVDRIKIMVNSDGIAVNSDEIADENEYDMESYLKNVEELDELSESTAESKEKGKYEPVFLSTNAITLSDKVQLIVRFHGSPGEIHENYDFIHTTNYWTFDGGLVTNTEALEAILSRTLSYVGSKYPIASLIRSRKFINRGWSINAGQYLKMAMQISKLDLTNIYVLEDQLVGVDSIYFLNFIEKLKEDIESGKKKKEDLIDNTYIMSVVDRIFG